MSESALERFAAAALTGLLARKEWPDRAELAAEAWRIAEAMVEADAKEPESAAEITGDVEPPVLGKLLEVLDLPMRVIKKLETLRIRRVHDLTNSTIREIKRIGLEDESVRQIKQALHRHGLKLSR